MLRRRVNITELRRRVILGFLLCAGSFFVAHTVNAVVEYSLVNAVEQAIAVHPVPNADPDVAVSHEYRQELVRSILSSGIFPLPPPPKNSAAPGSGAAAAVPPLNLASKVSLLGIVRGVNDQDRAIIEEVSSKKQGLYRVSQRVLDAGELVVIEKDRVLIREGEQEEWLDLAIVKQRAAMMLFLQIVEHTPDVTPSPTMTQRLPARRSVDRAQLTALAANPQTYLTEARFQPHFSGSGQIDGFHVDGIRQVGLLEKAGLQNGDVLAGVNGVEVRDPGKLWEIFKQLPQERTVRFNIVRNSQPMILAVEIRG